MVVMVVWLDDVKVVLVGVVDRAIGYDCSLAPRLLIPNITFNS